jgi:2-hydroxychromene-2-carboxylate isomerase
MSNVIVPYIANVLFSDFLLKQKRHKAERTRLRQKKPHQVTVYLSINDPYSYLLLQVLPKLKKRFSINFDFRTVLNRPSEMFPAPQLWDKNAFNDAVYLCNLYGLNFPSVIQEPAISKEQLIELDAKITAQLLHWELQPAYLDNALSLFAAYWQGDYASIKQQLDSRVCEQVECYQHHLLANEKMLKDNGHYLAAMLHYGGEWYWGLDRLQYLEQRLNDLNLNTDDKKLQYNLGHKNFCTLLNQERIELAKSKGLNNAPIEMYWSLRSPYSYLAIMRMQALAKYYEVQLIVKPVLPMVMRRMQVPTNKKNYIAHDAKRVSREYGIDFGFISDPLGKGVENCYALYDYAKSNKVGVKFLQYYAQAVWSQGVRSDTQKGLKTIVESVGLNWAQAQRYLSDDSWKIWAQDNLAQLYGEGLWGVPSFKYLNTKAFGQDRINLIESEVVKHFTVDNSSYYLNLNQK